MISIPTQIWLLPYDACLELEPKEGWPLSSASDQKRLKSIRHDSTRNQFALARLLAFAALKENYGPQAATWRIGYGEKGRPLLKDCPIDAPDISLSHTHGIVAFGLTQNGLIGVDVEDQDRKVDIHLLAKEVFSPTESASFQNMASFSEQQRFFFQNWTLKEAYTKALGLGLYAAFRSIEMTLRAENQFRLESPAKDDPHPPEAWNLHHRVLFDSIHTAFAHLPTADDLEPKKWQTGPICPLTICGHLFNVIQIIKI